MKPYDIKVIQDDLSKKKKMIRPPNNTTNKYPSKY